MQAASSTLVALMNELERAGEIPGTQQLTRVAETLAKCFEVQPDEVAVLILNRKLETLHFVIPEPLAHVGSIPVRSGAAVVARTVRERRAEVLNNASTARHLNVFEGVRLGRREGDYIHKLMSAPILEGHEVLGAVQISRKGQSPTTAGPDFTQKDLSTLKALTPVLAHFLRLCQVKAPQKA